jgi:hypothetical protein
VHRWLPRSSDIVRSSLLRMPMPRSYPHGRSLRAVGETASATAAAAQGDVTRRPEIT